MRESDREALEKSHLLPIFFRGSTGIFQGDDDLPEESGCSYKIAD